MAAEGLQAGASGTANCFKKVRVQHKHWGQVVIEARIGLARISDMFQIYLQFKAPRYHHKGKAM